VTDIEVHTSTSLASSSVSASSAARRVAAGRRSYSNITRTGWPSPTASRWSLLWRWVRAPSWRPPARRSSVRSAIPRRTPGAGASCSGRSGGARSSRGALCELLSEADHLLGVADVSRLGALRFRNVGEEVFHAPTATGVPGLLELGRLLGVIERLLRDEETDADLQLILAPGSSLGGARPKVSVIDQHGRLSIAKLPRETDDYSVERWESIALALARAAGIQTPEHQLLEVGGRAVLLSRRFDRDEGARIPFLSALSMMGLGDGERASYPELSDLLSQYGAQARRDTSELFRRMAFNVLVSNVDDHLRNHGFLWLGRGGWTLSPAYDLNPTPADVRPRVLTTNNRRRRRDLRPRTRPRRRRILRSRRRGGQGHRQGCRRSDGGAGGAQQRWPVLSRWRSAAWRARSNMPICRSAAGTLSLRRPSAIGRPRRKRPR